MRAPLSGRLLLTLVCLAATGLARASAIDHLIAGLTGDDGQARSLARQLLPRHAMEAMPKLIALLGQEKTAVRQAAFRVLADIANDLSAPGREADRAAMTDSLMTLVSSAQPQAVRLLGLRLLPIVIPPGLDVGPIAALLDEPTLREKAREALE